MRAFLKMVTGSERQQSRRVSGAQRSTTHRSTLSLQKTEILINVYDLLPVDNLTFRHRTSAQERSADYLVPSRENCHLSYGYLAARYYILEWSLMVRSMHTVAMTDRE